MKYPIYIILFVLLSNLVHGQNRNLMKKSLIKVSTDNLSDSSASRDTLYTRYFFDRDIVHVSLEPAWDGLTMKWEFTNNGIKIGFQDYTIKELSDTSLVLEEQDFRRIRLLTEEYLISKSKMPVVIDTLNGKPVYRANKIITARYQKGKSLSNELEKLSHGYNIRQLSRLRIEFVVNEKGLVQNVKVVEGITPGLDNAMASAILNTSKKWKPAQYDGQPIQVLMTFESRYINTSPVQILNRQ
jgi:hypothetical protein